MTRISHAAAGALCALAFVFFQPGALGQASSSAPGEAYPGRPVRIVNHTGPGGSIDLVARTLSQKL